MSKIRVLVTGHTGFLGSHVMPLLEKVAETTCISRSDPKALQGDLSFWDGKLDLQKLKGRFDVLLHMAGLYNLRINHTEALRQNVMTTHTALAIAQKAAIPHFIHMSTVGVTIRHKAFMVRPDELDTTVEFPDWYCYSKAYTEELVKNWRDGMKSKTVIRLGILVGDSREGTIRRIDGPYHAADAMKRLAPVLRHWPGPLPLPGNERGRLPLVPVDRAADGIVKILETGFRQNWSGYKAFHLAPRRGLDALGLYQSVLNHLGLSGKSVKLVDFVPAAVAKRAADYIAGLPQEEVEYLLNLPALDTSDTRRLLGDTWCPEFSDYEDVFWKGFEAYVSNS